MYTVCEISHGTSSWCDPLSEVWFFCYFIFFEVSVNSEFWFIHRTSTFRRKYGVMLAISYCYPRSNPPGQRHFFFDFADIFLSLDPIFMHFYLVVLLKPRCIDLCIVTAFLYWHQIVSAYWLAFQLELPVSLCCVLVCFVTLFGLFDDGCVTYSWWKTDNYYWSAFRFHFLIGMLPFQITASDTTPSGRIKTRWIFRCSRHLLFVPRSPPPRAIGNPSATIHVRSKRRAILRWSQLMIAMTFHFFTSQTKIWT